MSCLLPPGREWASGDDDHFVAQGLYNFKGESQNELSFQAGQYINVAPKGEAM